MGAGPIRARVAIALLVAATGCDGSEREPEPAIDWTGWEAPAPPERGDPLHVPVLLPPARECDAQEVRRLIAHGADVDDETGGRYSSSPLSVAVGIGCLDVARQLVDAGADLRWRRGESGHTLLTIAIVNLVERDMATFLIERGADVNTSAWGKTPLAHAIESFPLVSNFNREANAAWAEQSVALVRLLIERGARVGAPCEDGLTLEQRIHARFSGAESTAEGGPAFYREKERELLEIIAEARERQRR